MSKAKQSKAKQRHVKREFISRKDFNIATKSMLSAINLLTEKVKSIALQYDIEVDI